MKPQELIQISNIIFVSPSFMTVPCVRPVSTYIHGMFGTLAAATTFWKQLDRKMGIADNRLDNLWASATKKLSTKKGQQQAKKCVQDAGENFDQSIKRRSQVKPQDKTEPKKKRVTIVETSGH